jgi:hypothetical protein
MAPIGGGRATTSKLSLLSGEKQKLDIDPANGHLWRKAAVRTQTASRD